LKQVCDQLNNEEGSILASSRLADLYRKQGRWAEAVLEGQKLLLRLPKDSDMFREVEHQTRNTNIILVTYEQLAASRPADYRFLEMLKHSYSVLDIDEKRDYFTLKLAQAYAMKGKWSRATSEYRELLRRHPDDDGIKKILADLEEREREQIEEAA
jgi:tetratricopeptide (TPR) repeat protein